MGKRHITLEALSILMQSDTAHLTRNLYIPAVIRPQTFEQLISFLRKRGMEPFDKLTMSFETFSKTRDRLGPFYLQSLRYDLTCLSSTTEIWFPNFTRDIGISGGIIRNIPDRIVNLKLHWLEIDKAHVESIGQARFLTSLELEHNNITIRGLPEFLEKLTLKTMYGVKFEEGPNYNYHCEYLTHLEYKSLYRRAAEITLPANLVSSMITSLTHLSIRRDTRNSFATILGKLENLEELCLDALIVGDYALPISTKLLKIGGECVSSYSDILKPLPALTRLVIPCIEEFVPMMTGILRTSPSLKSLRTIFWEETDSRPPLPTGVFPQVETFYLDAKGIRKMLIMWNRSNELFRVFPNLNTVECRLYRHEWKADFTKKELYIESSKWMYYMPRTTPGRFISLADTEFERFHFSFYGDKPTRQSLLRCNLKLPDVTTEVTLTFCGYKKNSDGFLSRDSDTDTTIQYNVRELVRKSNAVPPRPVVVRVFSRTGRIYTDFSLENGRYVDHLFGQYKPPGSKSSSADEHEDTDSD